MNKAFFYFLISLVLHQSPLCAELRTFTNVAGNSIQAELIEVNDTDVTIKRSDGQQFKAPIDTFSLEDQKYFKMRQNEALASKQILQDSGRITISAKMNRKSKDGVYDRHSRVDDKTNSYFPEVVIENDDIDTYKDNSVRIVVIAEDKGNEELMLIVSASTLKADFLERGKTILDSDPFHLRSYEYNSSGGYDYEFGYEYTGYVVVVKNSKGEITHSRASKSKYLTNMSAIINCKAGDIYDENIDHKLKERPNSYFVRWALYPPMIDSNWCEPKTIFGTAVLRTPYVRWRELTATHK